MDRYAVLINTCDAFRDCWEPFFRLWSLYWPDCRAPVYLNTEYLDWSFAGLDIVPLKVCVSHRLPVERRVSWSQCLIWALEMIGNDIVLYLQEDYFLKGRVKNDIVEEYADLMRENRAIRCIHLTDQSVRAEGRSEYYRLDRVSRKQRYRVSCQAALWRREELLELLRSYESAWEFEEFGSQRSAVLNRDYYVVDRNWVIRDQFEIIPYIFTGIVQGRWLEEVVTLFEKHGIDVDFTERGLAGDAPAKPFCRRAQYRICKIFKIIRNALELRRLRKEVNA